MGRYEIALKSNRPLAYRFRRVNNISLIQDYMKRCFDDGVMFDVGNLDCGLVDSALAKFSTNSNIPLIFQTDKKALSFSIAYDVSKVYSVRQDLSELKYAICYMGVKESELPVHLTSVLKIVRGDEEVE